MDSRSLPVGHDRASRGGDGRPASGELWCLQPANEQAPPVSSWEREADWSRLRHLSSEEAGCVARGPEADVLGYMESLCNWGRWGSHDRLGTVNLVTPGCRRDAAALVREGLSVSCAHDIDPSIMDPIHQFHRYMVMSGEGLADPHRLPHMVGGTANQRWSPSREYIGMVFHGPLVTHVDAPSAHVLGPEDL